MRAAKRDYQTKEETTLCHENFVDGTRDQMENVASHAVRLLEYGCQTSKGKHSQSKIP